MRIFLLCLAVLCLTVLVYSDRPTKVDSARKSVCKLYDLLSKSDQIHDDNLKELKARVKYLEKRTSCPPKYEWYEEGSYCFRHITFCRTWKDARNYCMQVDGNLMIIQDDVTFKYFQGQVKKNKEKSFCTEGVWLGATDQDVEGKWNWISGDPLSTKDHKWGKGLPESHKGQEDCLEMRASEDYSFADKYCGAKRQFLCQYTPQD